MIEQPPGPSNQAPLHLYDGLVSDGRNFQEWDDRQAFDQKSSQLFQFQNTDGLEGSVGCLLRNEGNSLRLIATAFVVKHPKAPSNLMLDNLQNPIKALLLTAAHVYSSPLSFQEITDEIYFSLSPSVSDVTLNTYSKFRVQRLLSFDPSEGDEQIDPLTNYQYMVSQDLELLAILERDSQHQWAVNGNDFNALEYQSIDQPLTQQPCVIVGYPGRLEESEVELWAPIIGRNPKLEDEAKQIGRRALQDPSRIFSTGQVIGTNATCIAVKCSTWAGMSGSPICIASKDKKSFEYCGVYNGSAATPFQAFLSKIFFRVQGKGLHLNVADIPTIRIQNQALPEPQPQPQLQQQQQLQPQAGVPNPPRPEIQNRLLWAKILHNLLLTFATRDSPKGLLRQLSSQIRSSLRMAEEFGINVEHNLGVCGGNRFRRIQKCIKEFLIIQGYQILDFNRLKRFDANSVLNQNQALGNLEAFWNNGINRKRRQYLFLTLNAKRLALDLVTDLDKFLDKVNAPANINTIAEDKVERKFQKQWRKFSKIFEIWMTSLNSF